MCGIAGMIDPRLGREEGETLLERMLRSIRHRGPDYSSSWVEMPVLLGPQPAEHHRFERPGQPAHDL